MCPCDCSYMEPTAAERQKSAAATLYLWTLKQLGRKIPEWLKDAAEHIYGEGGERAMGELCALLRVYEYLHPDTFENLVYDGRNPTSRKLADWWEEHKKQDQRKPKS